MVLFNITLADFVLMSADVILKSTTILKEMRIPQLSFLNERTLKKTFKIEMHALDTFNVWKIVIMAKNHSPYIE